LYELLALEQTDATRGAFHAMARETREAWMRTVLTTLLRHAANDHPILVVVEDIHWAEPLAVARIGALCEAIAALPVVFLLATRLVGDPVDAAFMQSLGDTPLNPITLGAFNQDQMYDLARSFEHLDPARIADCIDRSEGNPLFLDQLLRHANENEGSRIPGSVRSLVLSRMDRLTAGHRWALQAASVIGQRWQVDGLRHLIDDASYRVDPLVSTRLIRAEPSSYLFSHALIHEGAYSSLLKRHATQLHQRAADWFAERDHMLRAQHLDRAGDGSAVTEYLASATHDIDLGRYERARTQLSRALELDPSEDDQVLLRLQQGRLLHDIGDIPGCALAYRAALDHAQTDLHRCKAWIGLATSMRVSDDIDGALAVLDKAQHVAETQQQVADRARIHYLRGSLLFPRADIDGCLREHGMALDYAQRAGAALSEAQALSGLGDAMYASGQMQSAYHYFQQCMERCREHGFGRLEAANRFMVGTVRIYLHELDGALSDSLESADLALRVGNQRAEIVSRLTAGWILISLGRWAEAERQAETGLAVADAIGATRFDPFLRESVARIAWYTGATAEARQIIGGAVDKARSLNMLKFIGPWLLGTQAMLDPTRREDALAEGWSILASGAVGHNHYHFHAHGIEAELDSNQPAAVERHAAALEHYTTQQPNAWADFRIRRGRALAAVVQGCANPTELGALQQEALGVGLRPELVRIQDALGVG